MSDDDDQRNLEELTQVIMALADACAALKKAMEGSGRTERELFTWKVAFAYGRLSRVCDRIYPAKQAGGNNAS